MTVNDLFNSKDCLEISIELANKIGLNNAIIYTEIRKAKKENHIDLFSKQDLIFVKENA